MAFANLFTRLAAVGEDVRSPGQTPSAHRNECENGQRGNARKRKRQGEQTASYTKKQCYQEHGRKKIDTYNATSFEYDDSKSIHYRMQNTGSEHTSIGFTKDVIRNHTDKAGHSDISYKGQNYTAKNNHNLKKQKQQKKKTAGEKNQLKDRQKHSNRGGHRQTSRKGGGDHKYKYGKQDSREKPPRFMTQEFKDQNALLVDGRLLCRHFLWGRCIKGDSCQLEHIQGYNDLIKDVCKFYIQGFCTKGERCPYMHKSFPCKFFHRKGKCSQGADCRFSHEPLNEVTNRLLDEALKRDNDLYELTKKAEQESPGQPANTDESAIVDTERATDILIQPVRPNFYNSEETNAEQNALLCQTEELSNDMAEEMSNDMDEAVAPQTQPHSPPSTEPNHEEPVCYSVEAVLGRQLFKPFPNFFPTPQSQESTSFSVEKTSSECTPGSANQSEVPYCVDAVLRSCKSVESSTFGHTPTPPPAQTVSYTPITYCEEVTDHLLSSEIQNECLSARNKANKSQKKMFESMSSHHVHSGMISQTCSDPTLVTGDHIKQGEIPESVKPEKISERVEVKLELLHSPATVAEKSSTSKGNTKGRTHLPADITCSVKCESEDVPSFGPRKLKNLTCTPKHPTPRVSGQTSKSQASEKPICPSSGFSEFKGRAAVSDEHVTNSAKTADSEKSDSLHFTAKQTSEIHQHSKKTQSGPRLGTQHHYSNKATADCRSTMEHCGDLSVESDKTQKIPFYSLFARPITDSLKPASTLAFHQSFNQSSCPTVQSAHCTSKHDKTVVEADKNCTRPFLSLFATPLSAAPLPCMKSHLDYSRTTSCSQSVDNTSDSKQRALNLETPLNSKVKTDEKQTSHRPLSPKLSTSPENENEGGLSEPVNQPTKQQVNPARSLVSDSFCEMSSSSAPCGNSPDLFTTHSQQQQPSMSSHQGSPVAAAANSVLKTLFVCLSPYQQDGEQQDNIQISVPPENEKDKSSTKCVFKKQRKSKKKKKLKTQDPHQQSPDKTGAHSTEHQPLFQTPQISLEATGGSTLCSPAMTETQARNSGTHNLPFKAVTPVMQHHTRLRLKHTSEAEKCLNGNMAATPLKNLFKTLDTTVFHFGH